MREIRLKIKNKQVINMPLCLAIDNENMQSKLIFTFDKFVNGTARLEYTNSNGTYYIMCDKENETYSIEVKSVMAVKGRTDMQLVITEPTIGDEIPVYKTEIFSTSIYSSLNAEEEEPEEYPTWLETANSKLNSIDSAEATRVSNETARETYITNLKSQVAAGNFKGAKGDKGDTGAKGDKGDKGEQGIQGIQGIPGVNGQNYVITSSDYEAIANIVKSTYVDGNEVEY